MEEKTFNLVNKAFILASVLVVGVLAFFVGQIVLQNRSIDLQDQNQISVSGTGKVYVKADIATVSLGMKTEGYNLKDIIKTNVDAMNNIVKGLKELGIEEKDLQTTEYNIYPKYNWTKDKGTVPDGYTISQSVSVKIRDFAKIGDVFKVSIDNKANVVGGLQFTIENPEKVRQEARAKAILQAKENANNLAKESGIKLGKLINVYEGYSPSPIMYSSKMGGMGGAEMSSAPDIQVGQQEVSVTINLTYQVK